MPQPFTPQTTSQNASPRHGVKLHATTDVMQPQCHGDHAFKRPCYSASRSPADNGMFAMNNLLTTLSLLRPEVPKFCGEITECRSFVSVFEAQIASVAVSNANSLYYLQQDLDGKSKELLPGCVYMNADDGYLKALEVLNSEYSHHYKVSIVYMNMMKTIREWPALKANGAVGLRKFSLFLSKYLHAMSCL